jgi:hypothetical protein
MRSILPSFKFPKTWEKLQRVTYDLRKQCGMSDNRVDCVANSLAFIGAMERDLAEEVSKDLNSREYGISIHDISSYLTGYGYERRPHYVQHITPNANIEDAYSSLKEGYGTLINLNRNGSCGHTATVIRIGGQLAVFDPQSEMISYNIRQWLESQSACSVELIIRVNKVSHVLEESSICVGKETDVVTKRVRVHDPPFAKKSKSKRPTHADEYIRKKEKSFARFIHGLEEAGFDYNQLARL